MLLNVVDTSNIEFDLPIILPKPICPYIAKSPLRPQRRGDLLLQPGIAQRNPNLPRGRRLASIKAISVGTEIAKSSVVAA